MSANSTTASASMIAPFLSPAIPLQQPLRRKMKLAEYLRLYNVSKAKPVKGENNPTWLDIAKSTPYVSINPYITLSNSSAPLNQESRRASSNPPNQPLTVNPLLHLPSSTTRDESAQRHPTPPTTTTPAAIQRSCTVRRAAKSLECLFRLAQSGSIQLVRCQHPKRGPRTVCWATSPILGPAAQAMFPVSVAPLQLKNTRGA